MDEGATATKTGRLAFLDDVPPRTVGKPLGAETLPIGDNSPLMGILEGVYELCQAARRLDDCHNCQLCARCRDSFDQALDKMDGRGATTLTADIVCSILQRHFSLLRSP